MTNFSFLSQFMVLYANIISIGLALISILLIGYVCGKFRIITKEGASTLNKYVFKICLIPVVVRALIFKKITAISFWPLAISTLVAFSAMITLSLSFLIPTKDKFGTFVSCMMPAAYINFLISGIPIFQSIWDPIETDVVAITSITNDLFTHPVYLLLGALWAIKRENVESMENGSPQDRKFSLTELKLIVLKFIQSPILIGNVVGLIYSATGLPVPTFLDEFLNLTGNVVLPMALFCIGVFLSNNPLMPNNWFEFLGCFFIRLFVSPGWAMLWCWALKVPGKLARQCIVLASQPTAVTAYLLAESAGLGQHLASTMVFWTTIFCIPVIILWMWVFDTTKIFTD